ncbi:MAG: hypothetical protein N4A49_14615 [Marinifilaceae bacterium]|jgi:hypothetical protein|nr:hypothetical protein [Marinifilaceae bacterium]
MLRKLKYHKFKPIDYLKASSKILSITRKSDKNELSNFEALVLLSNSVDQLEISKEDLKHDENIADIIELEFKREESWNRLYYYIKYNSFNDNKETKDEAYSILNLIGSAKYHIQRRDNNKILNKLFTHVDNNVDYLLYLKRIDAFYLYQDLKRSHQLYLNICRKHKNHKKAIIYNKIVQSVRNIRLTVNHLDRQINLKLSYAGNNNISSIVKLINRAIINFNKRLCFNYQTQDNDN